MILPRADGTLNRELAVVMGSYNLMSEASFLDHKNNVVRNLIVEAMNDWGDVSIIKDFVAIINSNNKIRVLS